MTEPLPIVGDPRIHKRFLDAHVALLQEFPAIQNLAAKMMLRVMHEHLVTASFIAVKPEEAKQFDAHASIQKWKVWTRTLDVLPQVKDLVAAEEITKLDEQQQHARAQLKSEICKKCGHPVTQAAWTRVDAATMAEQVDAATGTHLAKLYASCYLMPTALMHPTPFGLETRLMRTENDELVFNDMPESVAHDSLLRAHGLVLRLFSFVNDYFQLGLDAEIEARWATFPKIWDGALVDPPPETESETK